MAENEKISGDRIRVVNQLMSKRGGEICKRVISPEDGLLTWICVYRNPPAYIQFTLKKFSVPADINFGEQDVSDSVMVGPEMMDLSSIDEVEVVIREKYGEEFNTFQSPWAAECPF